MLAGASVLALASGCGRRPAPARHKTTQPAPAQAASIFEGQHGAGPAESAQASNAPERKNTEPLIVAKVEERSLPSASGALPLRIYTPAGNGAALPVIVYFHDGGSSENSGTHDTVARALANDTPALVVAMELPKMPPPKPVEQGVAIATEGATDVYRWVLKNADSLHGDARRVALVGEGGGGNVAEKVAIWARDQRQQQPLHVVLVCPDASGLLKTKLVGLPETTIINAEIDPLEPDGKRLTERLALAEVQVKQKTYVRMTHDFFGLSVGEARDARQFASERLRQSFDAASRGEKTVSGGGS